MDCNHCDQTFEQKKTLQKHLKQNHSRVFKYKYQCKICERSFKTRRSLTEHLRDDHEKLGERRDCSLCGLEYSNETELRRHSNLVHGEYIATLINNLQPNLPSEEPTESVIISDETFQLLENNLINSRDSSENTPPLRRSKRMKKDINYFLEKAEKSNKSETKKVQKVAREYELITLDSDSDSETPERCYSEEELSATVEITPMTEVSSQHFRSKLSRRLSETNRKTRTSSHNLSLPNWHTLKNEEKFKGGAPCDQCRQVFSTKKDLERHVEDKHSLKCTRCVATIIFQTKSAYKVHNERNHQD